MNIQIGLGDNVVLADPGRIHSTFKRMANLLNATKWIYGGGAALQEGSPGVVINKYVESDTTFVLVHDTQHDMEYVVNEIGLKFPVVHAPYEPPQHALQIGSNVRLVDRGKMYSTFHRMAGILGAVDYPNNSYKFVKTGSPGIIVNIFHGNNRMFCLVHDLPNDIEYIITADGLKNDPIAVSAMNSFRASTTAAGKCQSIW